MANEREVVLDCCKEYWSTGGMIHHILRYLVPLESEVMQFVASSIIL